MLWQNKPGNEHTTNLRFHRTHELHSSFRLAICELMMLYTANVGLHWLFCQLFPKVDKKKKIHLVLHSWKLWGCLFFVLEYLENKEDTRNGVANQEHRCPRTTGEVHVTSLY